MINKCNIMSVPILFFLLFMLSISGYAEKGQSVRKTIMVGPTSRSYMVYQPENKTPDALAPLVIVLHGANASGLVMSLFSGFNDLAEKNNFIVLYPDSYGPLWNDGRVDMDSISFRDGIDDVQFILHLVDLMVSGSRVDPRRVYVAGFSNGGMMALRLSIAASDRIAAAACIAGLLPRHLSLVRPVKPVPLLMIHGTDDRTVPWAGGVLVRGKKKRGEVLSVLDTVSYWARNNGCNAQVAVKILPDVDTRDGTVGFLVNYGCPDPDNELVLVSIQGGGHTWPGAAATMPDLNEGKTSRDLNASQFIWDFFSRHKRQ
jgi:polyhydroxybutyrate depolymerase